MAGVQGEFDAATALCMEIWVDEGLPQVLFEHST